MSSTGSFAFLASRGRTSLGGPFAGILVVSIRRRSRSSGPTSELFKETASHDLGVLMVFVARLDGDLVPVDLSNFSKSEKKSGDRGVLQDTRTMR